MVDGFDRYRRGVLLLVKVGRQRVEVTWGVGCGVWGVGCGVWGEG
jgi:hypothetical protein